MRLDALHSEILSASRIWTPYRFENWSRFRRWSVNQPSRRVMAVDGGAAKTSSGERRCTADELHYVPVPNSDWRLALWRYLPSPKSPSRNHPLLLLSGVGTNAVGYDLSTESSFARYMSRQGFETWILELRGAGLSTHKINLQKAKPEARNRSAFFDVLNLQERLSMTVKDLQRQFDLISNYNWDFDHYLEEDVPSAMEYIRIQSQPEDGKLHAIGHSMGGILLYAMIAKCCFEGRDSGLAAVTTLASSLDYTTSRSSLKLLLPLAEPAEMLNVPVIPIGDLIAAAHPFASYPPFVLSWLTPQISAPGMMSPELFEKLTRNNFCIVPAKLLLQLSTVCQNGGLRNRSGTFFYKDHVGKSNVPILALAGDHDLICPPDAVYETAKLIPERLLTYKVLGQPGGPHYAHYDLVTGRLAPDQVYSLIIEFLNHHDRW